MSFLPEKIEDQSESGQALVLILLTLAVVLTLVLFILSRTVTDIAISTREEEAVRAFSAAEAGVEKALVVGSSTGTTQIGDASFNASVSNFAEGSYNFAYPISLSSGDSATTWFVSHDTNGNLVCDVTHPCFHGSSIKVCWGKPGTSATSSTTPAVELSVFYAVTPGSYTTLRIARASFDPNSTRRSSNLFSSPDAGTCTIGADAYQFQKTLTFSGIGVPASSYNFDNGLQFARLRVLYNTDQGHPVGTSVNFPGADPLPSQGLNVDSTGVSGQSNRRLSVFQGWPEPPPIFDSVVFSATGLTK